ncbi:MAG TPA: GtrA family protein [Hyphomicrobiaceae bacterium]|nr:GtrA family protein [Hyphomicrobiaceae bacterium]
MANGSDGDMTSLMKRLRARLPARWEHYGGFLLSGTLAFLTDAAILEGLTRIGGLSPFLARLFSISIAMVVAWLLHRTITFAVRVPPSLSEFLQFAAVVWAAQLVNYLVFCAVLIALPGTAPLAALVFACLIAMFVSYAGYRFGVFRRHAGLP